MISFKQVFTAVVFAASVGTAFAVTPLTTTQPSSSQTVTVAKEAAKPAVVPRKSNNKATRKTNKSRATKGTAPRTPVVSATTNK